MRLLPVQDVLAHAWRSTISNLRFAWHISWPWLLLLVPLHMIVEPNLPKVIPESTDPAVIANNAKSIFGLVCLGLISLIAFSSIAVAWHRYVLKDEVPNGLARYRFDSVVWRYFGNTLLIILLVCLAVIPIVVVASVVFVMFGAPEAVAFVLIGALAGLIALPLAYRLMLKLPAIAVGNSEINVKSALEKTKGNSGRLFVSAFIVFAAMFLIGAVMYKILSVLGLVSEDHTTVFAVFVQQIVSWITTIFTVTFLTSLYGFFVEGREF